MPACGVWPRRFWRRPQQQWKSRNLYIPWPLKPSFRWVVLWACGRPWYWRENRAAVRLELSSVTREAAMHNRNSYTVVVVTWMGGGNVRPVLDTARDLISRGHKVHVLSNSNMESGVEEIRATFHAFKRIASHDPASPSTNIIRAYECRNIGETNNIIAERLLFGTAEALCHDTLDLIDHVHPQALTADY